jgi:hypothetical protein
LSREKPEKTIDAQALTKITQEIEELRQDAKSAEIDDSLKEYILDGLDDIASAIEDYGLEGIVSLERSVERAFGSLVLKGNQSAKYRESSVSRRFGGIVCRVLWAVATANGAVQLPHNVELLLKDFGVEHHQLTYDPESAAVSGAIKVDYVDYKDIAPMQEKRALLKDT